MASDTSQSDNNNQINSSETETLLNQSTASVKQDGDDDDTDEATVPKSTTPLLETNLNTSRKNSLSSSSSKSSEYRDICRICHCEGTDDEPLISPCLCLGTMQYLHQACLQRWIKSSGVKSCELCKFDFIMHSEIKPFKQWQKLEMNVVERRKIMCSVAFNLIAVTCVLWSLYVLIEKTREEVKTGRLQWQFWAKLIIVAIGFTGGLVFLYVQCKMYLQLCIRWRQFNQRIVIHSISEQHSDGILSPGKNSNKIKTDNCIITVLDATNLSQLNSNPSSTVNIDEQQANSSYPPTRNRNILRQLFRFHRSDQTQT